MGFQINQATIFPSKAENSSAFLCHVLCNGLVIKSDRPWVKPGASKGSQPQLGTDRRSCSLGNVTLGFVTSRDTVPLWNHQHPPQPFPHASEIQGAHFSSRHRSGTSPAQLEHLLFICITSQDLSTGFFVAEMRAIKKPQARVCRSPCLISADCHWNNHNKNWKRDPNSALSGIICRLRINYGLKSFAVPSPK